MESDRIPCVLTRLIALTSWAEEVPNAGEQWVVRDVGNAFITL
jgi:hypothetical protein